MSTTIEEHPVISLPLDTADIDIKTFSTVTIQETPQNTTAPHENSEAPSRASSAASLAISIDAPSVPSTAPSTVGEDASYQDEKPEYADLHMGLQANQHSCAAPPTQTQTQNALVVTPDGYRLVSDFPAPPPLGPTEVMIRNKATGLNHIDWMSVAYNFCLPELPWVTGREMAGVVEAVGASVTKLAIGDRVWTTTYYKERRAGCFQELVVVPQHTVFPIPETLDFHTAACLGVAGVTAAMTLWQWLDVPIEKVQKDERKEQKEQKEQDQIKNASEVLLIWGGSTVTGQFAIQLAREAGLEVVAVCSAATADLVRSRGAHHVVTYTGKTDMHVIGEILCCAAGRLTRAIDLVGARTARLVLQVIAAAAVPGRQVAFAPLAFMSSKDKDAVPPNARVHTVEIKQFVLNPASEVYGQRLNELVAAGVVQLPAVRVLEGGLEAVEQGLAMVKEGNLAGRKLVVVF